MLHLWNTNEIIINCNLVAINKIKAILIKILKIRKKGINNMSQQEFWNNKFSRDGFLYGLKPNTFISSKIKLFDKNSKVLCIGEGEGRNAIFFAKRGFNVTAVDASDIGLFKLQQRAKEEDLNIHTLCMDI